MIDFPRCSQVVYQKRVDHRSIKVIALLKRCDGALNNADIKDRSMVCWLYYADSLT